MKARSDARPRKLVPVLFGISAIVQLFIAIWVAYLSPAFAYGSPVETRPILSVLSLFGIGFIAQMTALWAGLRLPDTKQFVFSLVGLALLLRLVLFFTEPILEVDIYRYVWDGSVTSEGVSPYRYSPERILIPDTTDATLVRLNQLRESHPGLGTIHARVHFPQVTTVYPPVSQAVFAAAARLTPTNATAKQRVWIMKLFIVAFDVGVLILMVRLIRTQRAHSAWLIVYGWSPLVLKEFANSGHLDSIAVFATTAAVVCLLDRDRRTIRVIFGSAVCLALGVGAKLFPIVLFPVFLAFVFKRFGTGRAAAWTCIACSLSVAVLWPMFAEQARKTTAVATEQAGLATFLSRWEMNDLIFMVVEENIRPDQARAGHPNPWFVVVPERVRRVWTKTAQQTLGWTEERAPFLVARTLTTLLFVVLAIGIATNVVRKTDRFLPSVFLTLALFWLLSPTQNPWYWTWALPFVVFTRNRAWLLIAAVAMVYYARFWFDYHPPRLTLLGQRYEGTAIFDFIVVWLEFTPALVLIAITHLVRQRRQKPDELDTTSG